MNQGIFAPPHILIPGKSRPRTCKGVPLEGMVGLCRGGVGV